VLLKPHILQAIADGSVTAVFRRWTTPRAKAGSTFRTAAGVVAVDSVEPASEAAITDLDARKAGFESRAQLVSELSKYPDGELYRIAVRLAGPDPRVALRGDARLTAADVQALERKIAAMGARSKDGPWALRVLRLIEQRPGVLAARLAKSLDMDTALFKPRVRQLKELGLTESLEIGYRLSQRGQAFLQRVAEKRE
jgi:hypothetical protein